MARSRVELFEQIRKDRRVEGASIRELAGRHHVHRRTVRQALDSAVPPPRKGYPQRSRPAIDLAEAADQRQLSRVVGRYGRLDLLLLDELGYVQLDPRGAELLFQIITEREERASIAIGTNLPFSEWGTVFPDPLLVAAIVDRVTFNAHIVETGTQSYRLATSKTSNRKRAS